MNPAQLNAVTSPHNWTIVMAGPGSGKTRVQIERAKHMIVAGLKQSDLAFVTFSNNAANVLRKRLLAEKIVPGFCGTRHAMMLGMLRFKDPRWTMISEQDAEEYLQRRVKLLAYKGTAERLKAARQLEDRMEIYTVQDEAAFRVVRSYQMFMRSENLLDFDMVLSEGLRLLKQCPEFYRWRAQFEDEFQDSNAMDKAIILASNPEWLFVTADSDQAIYEFRGARPENVRDFWDGADHARFGGRFGLELNYRSSEQICEAANAVIFLNERRIAKRTISAMGTGGGAGAIECDNEEDERNKVLHFVSGCLSMGIPAPEIAVLCRTNKLVDELREMLSSRGLPMADVEGEKKPKDWRLLTLIMNMIAAPQSWAAARLLVREQAKLRKLDVEAVEATLDKARAERPIHHPARQWGFPALPVILSLNADFSRYGVSKASHALLADKIRLFEPTTMDELLEAMRASPETVYKKGITVQTVHSAKGEEFAAVCIAGAEMFDGDVGGGAADESNRLFFVAITRAKRELLILASLERRFQIPNTNKVLIKPHIRGPLHPFDKVKECVEGLQGVVP